MGQGPAFARHAGPGRPRDLHSLALSSRESPGSPPTSTSTAGLILTARASISSECWHEARERGYVFNVGIEPEFFLVVKNADGSIRGWDPHGVDQLHKPCYDFKGISGALDFLRALSDGLNRLGWGVYQSDHEDANFQYEVNFHYADALTTADRLTFFRMMAGQLAQRAGAIATFMAKPFSTGPARARTCTITWPTQPAAPTCSTTSPTREAWDSPSWPITSSAACSTHAPALCAVTSPTVNCYKRLQMGPALTGSRSGYTWTPAFISYGDNNRTQMIRVPEAGHVEDRSISSAFNPYLGIAAYLAAGLDGIARGLDPGEPNLGNLYTADLETMARRGIRTLPQSLPEALAHFENDSVIRESLGPIADEFLRLKRDEWREYHAQVESWEIGRYLSAT